MKPSFFSLLVLLLTGSMVVSACGGGEATATRVPPTTTSASAASAALTDAIGQTVFNVAGQNVLFQFVDESTGSPIPGLGVGFALDRKTNATGLLMVLDPYDCHISVYVGQGAPVARCLLRSSYALRE